MTTASEELRKAETEILDPITGEIVALDDADALCESLARIQAESGRLRVAEVAIRHALGALVVAETRTAKIIGRRYEARIERPGSSWDNATLRRLWDEYPTARQYMRIERIAPAMREIALLRNSNGPGVDPFKEQLLGAEKPSSAPPSIRIVERAKIDTTQIEAELAGLEF